MQRKKVRLEFLSRAKVAPQRRQRKTTAEWMIVQIFFPPPKFWHATALQTRRYLCVAMATGARLFQAMIVFLKNNQIAQSWEEPRSRQDDILKK